MNNNQMNNMQRRRPPLSREEHIRRVRMMKRRRADVRCLLIMGTVFFLAVFLNMFQFNRPTESEVEKRKLAAFPEFSFASLTSGEFTEGINSFFADTFFGRDTIVSLAKKMDTLRGYDFSVGDGSFVLLESGGGSQNKPGGMGDKLDGLLSENTGESTTDSDPEDVSAEGITLSKTQLTLTVGGGAAVNATVSDGGDVKWSVDNENTVSLSVDGNSVNLKALAEGNATVTCTSGDFTAECKVKIDKIASGGVDNGGTADFMTNGLFIYGDAVYTQSWYIEENVKDFARTAAYYKKLFPNARVNVCIAPTSAIQIDNAEVKEQLADQEAIFSHMAEIMADSDLLGGVEINFVNTYEEMYNHRDEYIFFRSDHHWTQRGAYYAYKAFVESVGLEATPLSEFELKELSTTYSGSMYEYTKDERVKAFKDTVEAFMTDKKLTMTVTDRQGNTTTYSEAVMTWSKTYSAFLCGDNPYTVINVPENPQDRNILVLKDSYGNAFTPFLAENYGNIMIVDTRYTSMNVKEMFADYDITDILFINNLEAANSPAWTNMYLKAVGIED